MISVHSSFSWESMWPDWMRSTSFFNFLSRGSGDAQDKISGQQSTVQVRLPSCGRTCTAPVCRAIAFSVPLFSPRLIYGLWRLQWFRQPRPSHHVYVYNREGETIAYKNNNNNRWSHLWGTSIILTWELLWLPAALSIVRHSAKKKKKRQKLLSWPSLWERDSICTWTEKLKRLCQILFTFCENQSGGRPGSEKGFIARLTDTLEDTGKKASK